MSIGGWGSSYGSIGAVGGSNQDRARWQQQHDTLARMAMGSGGGYNPNSAANLSEQYWNTGKDMAQGRLGAMQGDPMDAAISAHLMDRINGKDVPYTQQVRDSYLTNASNQAAQAAQQQTANLRGNPSDPGWQAAQREIDSNRQMSGQSALLGINMNADLANYNARGQAMSQGAGFESNRNQALNNQSNLISGMYQGHTFTDTQPSWGSYGAWNASQGGSGGVIDATPPEWKQAFSGGGMPGYSLPSGYGSQNDTSSVWAGSGRSNPAPVGNGTASWSGGSAYATPAGPPSSGYSSYGPWAGAYQNPIAGSRARMGGGFNRYGSQPMAGRDY